MCNKELANFIDFHEPEIKSQVYDDKESQAS
jgi:hypothetical protein